jgi:hypothetical protein
LEKSGEELDMAETSDYDPGAWRGHDFKSAYSAYDATAGRAYSTAVKKGAVKPTDFVPKTLETDSESPVVILLDGTGSMRDWPATIFSKLPYLDIEGKEYMGPSMAISFGVFSDVSDPGRAVLQVQPFATGLKIKETLEKMFIPGGGGGGLEESSELAMAYFARNVSMPNATKPLLIVITDERCYEWVDKGQGETYAHLDLADETRLSTHKVVHQLQQKYNVYAIIKPYGSGTTVDSDPSTKAVYDHWIKLFGAENVVSLPDPNRVVDVIFGIMARETGRVAYFEDELKGRQLKDAGGKHKVDVVLKSLKTIHKSVKALPGPSADKSAKKGASVTVRKGASRATTTKSVSLLD